MPGKSIYSKYSYRIEKSIFTTKNAKWQLILKSTSMSYILRFKMSFLIGCFLVFSLSCVGQTFKHPGILNSRNDLDFVKAKIAANQYPWANAFNSLASNTVASLTYTPSAIANSTTATTQDKMTLDGQAAYAQTLLWYFSGNQKYADNAINILNAWSSTFVSNTNFLYLSWAVPHFINAAEILRYNNSGWAASDIQKFNTMVRTKFLVQTVDSGNINNIMMSNIEAQMAIGIYLDSAAVFNYALNRWRYYVPTYFYTISDGGTKQRLPNRPRYGAGATPVDMFWAKSPRDLIDGMCEETCRDLGHMNMGASSIFFAAEMAWQQGVDLFSEEKTRITAFLELHTGWLTGQVPIPSNICTGCTTTQTGHIACTGQSSTVWAPCANRGWDICVNHYVTRLGMSLPLTTAYATTHVNAGTGYSRNDKPETLIQGSLPTSYSKQNQLIIFPPLPAKTVGDADFNGGATTSSGLAVTYQSLNTTVATIVNGNIHILGAGTSTISASQDGNLTYNPASIVSQTLTVNFISGVNQFLDYTVEIFPNPASDYVHIQLNSTKTDVSIYNSIGMKVYSVSGVEKNFDIPISEIGKPGVYFMKLNNITRKLILERSNI